MTLTIENKFHENFIKSIEEDLEISDLIISEVGFPKKFENTVYREEDKFSLLFLSRKKEQQRSNQYFSDIAVSFRKNGKLYGIRIAADKFLRETTIRFKNGFFSEGFRTELCRDEMQFYNHIKNQINLA